MSSTGRECFLQIPVETGKAVLLVFCAIHDGQRLARIHSHTGILVVITACLFIVRRVNIINARQPPLETTVSTATAVLEIQRRIRTILEGGPYILPFGYAATRI